MHQCVVPTLIVVHVNVVAHKCKFKGCGEVLVLDGNCKNRRDVCAATEAGFIEYSNLPGTIKTGCQLSPMRTSKYCFRHAPRVSVMSLSPDPESESVATTLYQQQPQQHGIVRMIVKKKITRNKVYYQVTILSKVNSWG